MRTFYRECAHWRLVRAHLCTNLHEIFHLSLQDSDWPPHKISWRSKLSLRRYLQNNTGVCLILNFQCILHIFTIWASKFLKNWQFFWILPMFFKANLKMYTFHWNFPNFFHFFLLLTTKNFMKIRPFVAEIFARRYWHLFNP